MSIPDSQPNSAIFDCVSHVEFFQQLANLKKRTETTSEVVAVVRFGIDRFRNVNRTHGFTVGDQVLAELDGRLSSLDVDYLVKYRLGNSEYGLLLKSNTTDELKKTIGNLFEILSIDYLEGDEDIHLNFNAGVAIFPGDGEDETGLMLAAESAKEQAKKEGSDQIRFYLNTIHGQTIHHARLEKELDRAIAEEQFFLVYQPKVDSSNGLIKGFEALIRWRHPERGLVSPVEFIPVLEESNKIVQVGNWVIESTCRALKNWIDHGMEVVPVSVNVSMPQFKEADFVENMRVMLQKHGVPANLLEIEITESCLMDDGQESIAILKQLKEMGILISIDDFGTGYSSLSYLKRFPIDTLKIDRSFITNVHNRKDNDNAGIVTAIMALSHSLRLNVVAEGVEQPHELAFLHALGCRIIQGFLFSRPLEEDKVEELLRESLGMEKTLNQIKETLQAS